MAKKLNIEKNGNLFYLTIDDIRIGNLTSDDLSTIKNLIEISTISSEKTKIVWNPRSKRHETIIDKN